MCWTVDKLVFELASGIRRSVASELGEVVSIRDSGADVGDCSAILTSLNAVGLILNKNVETSMAPRTGRWFAVAPIGNAAVKLVAGSNVAVHHPDGELIIPQWATAICFYIRIDAASSRLSVTEF